MDEVDQGIVALLAHLFDDAAHIAGNVGIAFAPVVHDARELLFEILGYWR